MEIVKELILNEFPELDLVFPADSKAWRGTFKVKVADRGLFLTVPKGYQYDCSLGSQGNKTTIWAVQNDGEIFPFDYSIVAESGDGTRYYPSQSPCVIEQMLELELPLNDIKYFVVCYEEWNTLERQENYEKCDIVMYKVKEKSREEAERALREVVRNKAIDIGLHLGDKTWETLKNKIL